MSTVHTQQSLFISVILLNAEGQRDMHKQVQKVHVHKFFLSVAELELNLQLPYVFSLMWGSQEVWDCNFVS